jgi:membrane protein YdbS with pleckstrin-like domain
MAYGGVMTNEEKAQEKKRLEDSETLGSIVFWVLLVATAAMYYQGEVYQFPFAKAAAVVTGLLAVVVVLGVARNQIIRHLL